MKKVANHKDLVELLLNKDDLALQQLYVVFANELYNYFLNKYPVFRNDTAELEDIITDSLFALVKSPEKYNPSKTSLKTFLIRDINGNVLNELEKKNRATSLTKRTVELNTELGNIREDNESDEELNYEKLGVELKAFFAKVFNSEKDRLLAWMIIVEKTRETKKFETILDIKNKDVIEQEEIVKKHKDRINIKLKRNGLDVFLKQLRKNG